MGKATKRTAIKPERFTPDQVVTAIQATKGLISQAATHLHCDRGTIYDYMKRYPEIRDALKDEREAMTDVAELALYSRIIAGEGWAICFYLKTQGKGRGYVERHEVTGKDGEALEFTIRIDKANEP